MGIVQVVKGDLKPVIQATLQYDDGSAVNLTGATVKFQLFQNGVKLIDRACTITNATAGQILFTWQTGDTNLTGQCPAQFKVTFADSSTQTFPTSQDFFVEFTAPPTATEATGYVDAGDVSAHLNAAYDGTTQTYNVYGLKISAATLQAHVDHANNWVNNTVGGQLAPTDSLYLTAWFAALDIACIQVLVVSMGGSLVGAFDYFLGDLRVARAGPYKEAIMATLQGFKDDLARQLVNLTPAAAVISNTNVAAEVPFYKGPLMEP